MSDDAARERIRSLLEGGLETEVEPRADSDAERASILAALREASAIEEKIRRAGFTLKPVQHEGTEQACDSCMYFAVRRRFCELPELSVAVEPEWSCRVWRI